MLNSLLSAYRAGIVAAFLLLAFFFLVLCLAVYDTLVLVVKAYKWLVGRLR